MPRPRPPHLHRENTRHGKAVWYVRVDKGPRIRIRANYGTPEFDIEHRAAVEAKPRPAKGAPAIGTLAWLVARYRETTAWAALSAATRRQRENIFRHVLETAGQQPYAKITSATITAGRERRASTPAQARHFLDTMRGLFRWTVSAGFAKADPTAGVTAPKKKGKGFRAWTEDDIAAYEARWPIGTRQRVWLDVLLYTGLRRGDAVLVGRQHVRGGVAQLTTEKTDTPVTLPILPVLQATLDAGPCGDLAFICGARGQPFTKESFGNEFREACNAAGVPGSAHGVRKIAATRAAENGATVSQLEAIFGWSGGRMASLYTQTANRRKLALEAMSKLGGGNEKQHLFPHLSKRCGRQSEKAIEINALF
jgi:integrase